jgi:protein-tyrosine phosphatase
LIDLHCHLLPGVDDGVRSLAEARDLARSAAAEGITAIAATPHVRSDYPTRAARIEFGVAELRRDFEAAEIEVEVLHGAEVEIARLWEIPPDELTRLTLAQTGCYVLLEFPYRGWPRGLAAALRILAGRGIVAVLGHPERNPEVQDRPGRLEELVRAGALVQVTSASLDGRLGRAARLAGERLVEAGLVHVLASDAHGPHAREGGLLQAAHLLGDERLARYLTEDVPAAIVAGASVPPRP